MLAKLGVNILWTLREGIKHFLKLSWEDQQGQTHDFHGGGPTHQCHREIWHGGEDGVGKIYGCGWVAAAPSNNHPPGFAIDQSLVKHFDELFASHSILLNKICRYVAFSLCNFVSYLVHL